MLAFRTSHSRRHALTYLAAASFAFAIPGPSLAANASDRDDFPTTTPIKHVVVIFQENVSFDHYFGTYPYAKPNANGTRFF